MRQAIDIEDFMACNLCNECNLYATEQGYPGSIRFDERDDKYIFTVEATGAIAPQNIVMKAMKVLKGKLSELTQPF